jgi:membrane protein DedA with SNARE-associated domain
VGYAIGAHYGDRLFELALIRRRRAALDGALLGLRRRGATYVFVGRFTAFFRAVMPALAGMSKMDYRRFLIANALSALLWGVGYCLLGYFAGGALKQIENSASWVGIAVLVAMLVLVAALYFNKRRREASRSSE